MRLRVSMIVLTGLIVLCGSGCSVSRRSVVKAESLEVRAESSEVRDERLEMMAVDTVKEVTMINVRENEAGDTVRLVQVTERERVRSRERAQEVVEKDPIGGLMIDNLECLPKSQCQRQKSKF